MDQLHRCFPKEAGAELKGSKMSLKQHSWYLQIPFVSNTLSDVFDRIVPQTVPCVHCVSTTATVVCAVCPFALKRYVWSSRGIAQSCALCSLNKEGGPGSCLYGPCIKRLSTIQYPNWVMEGFGVRVALISSRMASPQQFAVPA